MRFLHKRNKPFPLRPANSVGITGKTVKEAMSLILESTAKGQGGLFGIMKHRKKGLDVIHLDSLFVSTQKDFLASYKKAYTQQYIDASINTIIFMIKHAFNNPDVYGLKTKFRGKEAYDLAVLAVATPVDAIGNIATDDTAYGWEVVATTAGGMDFDFFIVDGEILTGSSSFNAGAIFPSENIYGLQVGPSPQRNVWKAFQTISDGSMSV